MQAAQARGLSGAVLRARALVLQAEAAAALRAAQARARNSELRVQVPAAERGTERSTALR